ncbi:MAG: hypothetical protein NUW37_07730 [Planctomycetes bacterium]|nr:hypothetical protein [Planctomycetota bacterium]
MAENTESNEQKPRTGAVILAKTVGKDSKARKFVTRHKIVSVIVGFVLLVLILSYNVVTTDWFLHDKVISAVKDFWPKGKIDFEHVSFSMFDGVSLRNLKVWENPDGKGDPTLDVAEAGATLGGFFTRLDRIWLKKLTVSIVKMPRRPANVETSVKLPPRETWPEKPQIYEKVIGPELFLEDITVRIKAPEFFSSPQSIRIPRLEVTRDRLNAYRRDIEGEILLSIEGNRDPWKLTGTIETTDVDELLTVDVAPREIDLNDELVNAFSGDIRDAIEMLDVRAKVRVSGQIIYSDLIGFTPDLRIELLSGKLTYEALPVPVTIQSGVVTIEDTIVGINDVNCRPVYDSGVREAGNSIVNGTVDLAMISKTGEPAHDVTIRSENFRLEQVWIANTKLTEVKDILDMFSPTEGSFDVEVTHFLRDLKSRGDIALQIWGKNTSILFRDFPYPVSGLDFHVDARDMSNIVFSGGTRDGVSPAITISKCTVVNPRREEGDKNNRNPHGQPTVDCNINLRNVHLADGKFLSALPVEVQNVFDDFTISGDVASADVHVNSTPTEEGDPKLTLDLEARIENGGALLVEIFPYPITDIVGDIHFSNQPEGVVTIEKLVGRAGGGELTVFGSLYNLGGDRESVDSAQVADGDGQVPVDEVSASATGEEDDEENVRPPGMFLTVSAKAVKVDELLTSALEKVSPEASEFARALHYDGGLDFIGSFSADRTSEKVASSFILRPNSGAMKWDAMPLAVSSLSAEILMDEGDISILTGSALLPKGEIYSLSAQVLEDRIDEKLSVRTEIDPELAEGLPFLAEFINDFALSGTSTSFMEATHLKNPEDGEIFETFIRGKSLLSNTSATVTLEMSEIEGAADFGAIIKGEEDTPDAKKESIVQAVLTLDSLSVSGRRLTNVETNFSRGSDKIARLSNFTGYVGSSVVAGYIEIGEAQRFDPDVNLTAEYSDTNVRLRVENTDIRNLIVKTAVAEGEASDISEEALEISGLIRIDAQMINSRMPSEEHEGREIPSGYGMAYARIEDAVLANVPLFYSVFSVIGLGHVAQFQEAGVRLKLRDKYLSVDEASFYSPALQVDAHKGRIGYDTKIHDDAPIELTLNTLPTWQLLFPLNLVSGLVTELYKINVYGTINEPAPTFNPALILDLVEALGG